MGPDQTSSAFRLIVAALDWPHTPDTRSKLQAAAAEVGDDWKEALRLIDRHRITPQVMAAFSDAEIDAEPQLVTKARQQSFRALANMGEAARVLDRLAEQSIDAIVLKGAVLSQQIYGSLAMRQMADLDVMVAPKDFECAYHSLTEDGYQLQGGEPPFGASVMPMWMRGNKDVTLVKGDGTSALELHHRLRTAEAFLPDLTMAKATTQVAVSGRSYATFSKADLFAYLCVHGSASLWNRLKWLADIRAICAASTQEEMREYFSRSKQMGVERCTALALSLCSKFWGQPLPKEVEEYAKRDSYLAQLINLSCEAIADPDPTMPSIGKKQLFFASLRLKDGWAYRISVARAFVLGGDITQRYRFPAWLGILYLPLRLWRWLAGKE